MRMILLLIACMAIPHPVWAKNFTLDDAYVGPHGVIYTYYAGKEIVDPYFSTKALLTANDSGMNIHKLGMQWAGFILAHQDPDGLISRLCHNEDQNDYMSCLVADADDSMMAIWIDLLYRLAPNEGLPESWKESAAKAERQLDSLYRKELGVYVISAELPVGLFMDNIEIYAALDRASKEARRMGDETQAANFAAKAARLKKGMQRTFWNEAAGKFNISTQVPLGDAFYPDIVAQIFPQLHGVKTGNTPPDVTYHAWMHNHREAWMDLIGKDFPWAQVALLAVEHRDLDTVSCWLAKVTPYRHSGVWDVLDEAAYQATVWKVEKQWPGHVPACKEAS